MEEIIISLENISDVNKINEYLQNDHDINSYEIIENNIIIRTKYSFRIPIVCHDLEHYGYKIIAVALKKNQEFVPIIEALNDKKEIEKEVLRENSEFDLESFYVKHLEGAVCVITKDKTIFVNAVIDHYTSLNAIYNMLYNNTDIIQNYYSFKNGSYWQEEAVSFGNVVIQLCSDVTSTAWLPKEMNSYQQVELKKIIDQINQISEKYNIPIDVEIGTPSDLIPDSFAESTNFDNSKSL